MNRPSHSMKLLAAAALLLAAAAPLRAYEISQISKNANAAAPPPSAQMNGQKLVLYGGQAILSHTSANASYNTFPAFASAFGVSATSLTYTGTNVPVNSNGGIFVRTGGNSALVKQWAWTNAAGTPQYNCTCLSGSVSAGSSSSSSRAGDVSAQAFDGSVYWTFYNGTHEQAVLESIKFHFVTDNETFQAQHSIQAVFGGAKPTSGAAPMVFLPPRGGVTYLVRPLGPADKRSLIVAEGIASRDGTKSSTEFVHQVPFPDCLCANGRGLKNSKGWHGDVARYLKALPARKTDATENTIAQSSVLLGKAQGWLNDLSGQFALGSVQAVGLLGNGYGRGNFGKKGRAELAALMMSRADNRVCLYDRVILGSTNTSVEAIIAQAARLITSRSARNQKKGYQLLFRVNNGKCQTMPGAAATGSESGPVTIGCGG